MAEERKYRLRVEGHLVEVTKDVYLTYYRVERHTKTLDEKMSETERSHTVIWIRKKPLEKKWFQILMLRAWKTKRLAISYCRNCVSVWHSSLWRSRI